MPGKRSGMASTSTDSNDSHHRKAGKGVSFEGSGNDAHPGGHGRKHGHAKKLDKEKKEASMKAEQLIHQDTFDMEDLYHMLEGQGNGPFQKPIVGDLFGVNDSMNANSILGMMYHSRIQEGEIEQLKRLGKDGVQQDTATVDKKGLGVEDPASYFEDGSDEEEENIEILNSRQQLALTIRNWSATEENDDHLLDEGAVHALIGLAGMDDNFIKSCCATALCNLSSRKKNREKLLGIGSASGIVQIAMATRNWKIAKLCAYTFSYLSMYEGGEAIMAGSQVAITLQTLLPLKGYRLLPLIGQTLYNLTCVEDPYKNVERSIKYLTAIMSLPSAQAAPEYCLWLMKSLVNCCRYSWVRKTIIEDGALPAILSVLTTTDDRQNKEEIMFLAATCMHMMSETAGCRIEMIQKGGLDILKTILAHADDGTMTVTMKALHNIMKYPTLSQSAFELCCDIACTACRISEDLVVLEYVSACLYQLAEQSMRGNIALADEVMGLLPKLISSEKPLTQYFAISAAGDLFFMKGTSAEKLESLIKNVIEKGSVLVDEDAVEGLLVALAKLSQDDFSMAILEKNNLFLGMLTLLLDLSSKCSTYGADRTVGIAICRITLRVKETDITVAVKKRISVTLVAILTKSHNLLVLGNTIAAMRALGDAGLCRKELLDASIEAGGGLFSRLASIVKEHGAGDETLSRNCCALLAGSSFLPESHEGLSADDVMETLFLTTRSDDVVTRELVAITLCNMTTSAGAAERLIRTGVCEIIATLSGATSESVQELCAKCICNLTCAHALHDEIISHGILQTILLIALVRTVKDKTKLVCARAVMNLMSDGTIEALKSAGAIRVFASIAAVPDTHINDQCAQGFLIFTTTAMRREDICSRKAVLQALFLMVKSPSAHCRITVGRTVCNLLSCSRSQRHAIHAGALHVVKIVSTMEYPILREAAARVIINLLQQPALHGILLKSSPIVPILSFIMQRAEGDDDTSDAEGGGGRTIFEYSVAAMSCACQMKQFRMNVIEESGAASLVRACMDGKVSSVEIATEVIRSFTLLTYEDGSAEALIDSHVLLALHILYRKGLVTPDSAEMIAIIVRNMSIERKVHDKLLEMGGFLLFRALSEPLTDKSVVFARACTIFAEEVCARAEYHASLVEQGLVGLIHEVVLPSGPAEYAKLFPVSEGSSYHSLQHNRSYTMLAEEKSAYPLSLSSIDIRRITHALCDLSTSPSARDAIVDGEFGRLVKKCMDSGKVDATCRYNITVCSRNLASSKQCREKLISAGLVETLLGISKSSMEDSDRAKREEDPSHDPVQARDTQEACTVALGYLSEITRVVTGDVTALLNLKASREAQEATKASATASKEAAAADEGKGSEAGDGTGASGDSEAKEDGLADGALITSDSGVTAADIAAAGDYANEARNARSAGTNSSGGGSRPGSSSKRSLKGMIKDGLLKGKNKQLVNQGFVIEGGVKVDHIGDVASKGGRSQKGEKGPHRLHNIMAALSDSDSHDMVSENSEKLELSMMQRDYDEFSYKTYDNSGKFTTEKGGQASKSTVQLDLPRISTDKAAEGAADNHHGESVASKAAALSQVDISEKSLPKDVSQQAVSTHDATVVAREEEEDEGYSSSNRDSRFNSRSATPVAQGPEEDANSSPAQLRTSQKMGKKGSRSKLEAKKVIPQAGAAWKGMQGDHV